MASLVLDQLLVAISGVCTIFFSFSELVLLLVTCRGTN